MTYQVFLGEDSKAYWRFADGSGIRYVGGQGFSSGAVAEEDVHDLFGDVEVERLDKPADPRPDHPLFCVIDQTHSPQSEGFWAVESQFGIRVGGVRVYPPLRSKPGDFEWARHLGDRRLLLSLGAYYGNPLQVMLYSDLANGTYQADVNIWLDWIATLPGEVDLTGRHEPDHMPDAVRKAGLPFPSGSKTDPGPQLYAKAMSYLAAQVEKKGLAGKVRVGMNLMGKTYEGRTMHPASAYLFPGCQFAATDAYADLDLGAPTFEQVHNKAAAWARDRKLDFYIWETNVKGGTDARQAEWLKAIPAAATKMGALEVCVFDGVGGWSNDGTAKRPAFVALAKDPYFQGA